MIVPTEELGSVAGLVTMVDGGFDPIHPGHVAYFREAHALGAPVLCNVSSDEWVARKHAPLLRQAERAEVIDAVEWVEYVHLSRTSTEEVLELLRPRYYAKGADWRDTLPAEQLEICARVGTEVVFLDTVVTSSTAILERWQREQRDRDASD